MLYNAPRVVKVWQVSVHGKKDITLNNGDINHYKKRNITNVTGCIRRVFLFVYSIWLHPGD